MTNKWSSPFDILARMLRGALIAAPGCKLYFADFASIEARGVAWAAGQQDIVELFARNDKIYEKTAAQIFGVAVEGVTQDQRFLGKGAVLGCGYGMGAERFQATCKKQGRVVTLDLAKKVVQRWRELNPRVVKFWRELEDAARAAVGKPGTVCAAGPFQYRCVGNRLWLQCRLPSGRLLWYRRPATRWAEGANGVGSLKLNYWGVDSDTKKWAEETTWGGKLLENCVQGMCRDFLAGALLRLEHAGYTPVLSNHDEILCETPQEFGSVEEFLRIMTELPEWANGFPLKAEGGSGPRYAK
jgi:DNA polymerase bacteriophage-type